MSRPATADDRPGLGPFDFDPGEPLRADDPDPAEEAPQAPPQPPGDDASVLEALDPLESVKGLLSGFWMGCHLFLGRGGPPDAFLPNPHELEQMARPAAAIVTRAGKAAVVARYGDPIGFATATGGFMAREVARTQEWKRRAAAELGPAPDSDLGGLGVLTEDLPEGFRPWRPPVPPVDNGGVPA